MSRFVGFLVAPVVLLATTANADAWYLGKWGVLPVFPAYHYRLMYNQGAVVPASYPVYYWSGYVYCPPVMASAPGSAPATTWAVPTPAPPSSKASSTTNEPPLQNPTKKEPAVSESRSFGGSYAISTSNANDVCRVGFWNLAGRDVVVQIGTLVHTVPKDKTVLFEVPRRFTWQMDQQQVQSVEVPAGGRTHEIVIR